MYVLGVDGGGTKIEFLVADYKLNPVVHFILEKNSNLKYVGPDELIANLQEGFQKIVEKVSWSEIVYGYFGIAECGNKDNPHEQKVRDFIGQYLSKYTLADDQYSCFRSLSDRSVGVLGIAGTGSAINLFSPEGNKINKSIGHGGRDFGRILLIEAKYNYLKPDSQIYQTVKNFLGQDPVVFYDNLTPEESIRGALITQIPMALSKEYNRGNEQLRQELDNYLVVIAGRWAHKLTTYCYASFGFREDDDFDIVLTGGMWGWRRLLNITTTEVYKIFPKARVLHDSQVRPVVGCIKLAIEKAVDQGLVSLNSQTSIGLDLAKVGFSTGGSQTEQF